MVTSFSSLDGSNSVGTSNDCYNIFMFIKPNYALEVNLIIVSHMHA